MASKQNDNSDRVMIPANIAAWCNGDFANHRGARRVRKAARVDSRWEAGGAQPRSADAPAVSQQGSSGNYANDSE